MVARANCGHRRIVVDPRTPRLQRVFAQVAGNLQLYRLAAITTTGRTFWIWPFVPLGWLAFIYTLEHFDLANFNQSDAQNLLIGFPMGVVAILLGVRIVASEINARNLEIIYTVPGGCEKVWWTKLLGAVFLLLPTCILLATISWFFITHFSWWSLYGAFQGAVFYLVLSMGLATLFRSEVGGAVIAVVVFFFNLAITGFDSTQMRISPFFNPYDVQDIDLVELAAHTIQNRIGYALVILALIGLTFMRTNRKERMLGA